MATTTADVARARIALAQAQVNLDNATLVAPIAGTVATMPFRAGHSMTATDAVTIQGAGSERVTVDVAETSIGLVTVGQAASVTASAGASAVGTVTRIGILPATSSSTGTASYPVTVTVPRPAAGLAPGVTGAVSITVAQAKKAVVLPVSAVTKVTDTTATVTAVDADNHTTSVQVVLGATGSTTVQIRSGLAAGQRVVVADNTQALPASNTTALRRAAGGGVGAGGGGFTGGGPPGGLPGGGVPPAGR